MKPSVGSTIKSSRRTFLRRVTRAGLVLASAPILAPRHVLGGDAQSPSDTLRLAAIGIGGMGAHYLAGCRTERVVALCDLDHSFAGPVFQKYPSATRYHDWRKLLDKPDEFDALIVATPDHTHAVILMAALQLKKHIYCAKPVTHTIGEARRVRASVLQSPNLITKTSVQSSATAGARATTELLASGVLGPIHEVHIWCDHPMYPCSVVRPTETQTAPPGMDWELWLGPAPYRPYHSAYHPWKWRPWWDFGSGTVGDMACHTFHGYFHELQLGAPRVIYGSGSTRRENFSTLVPTPECQSHANQVTWEYAARGRLPPLSMHWYDGGMKPHRPPELDRKVQLPASGLLFAGEKGSLLAAYSGGRFLSHRGLPGGLLLPEDKFKDVPQPAPSLPRVEDHYGEWVRACKAGRKTVCPLDFGCEMTEVALLGALALRTGHLLEWDSATMRVTNDAEAQQLVDLPWRKGWGS